jgi:hypothetical protein
VYGAPKRIELPDNALVIDICAEFSELGDDEIMTVELKLQFNDLTEREMYLFASGAEGTYQVKCVRATQLYTTMGGLTFMDDVYDYVTDRKNIVAVIARARSNKLVPQSFPPAVYIGYYV